MVLNLFSGGRFYFLTGPADQFLHTQAINIESSLNSFSFHYIIRLVYHALLQSQLLTLFLVFQVFQCHLCAKTCITKEGLQHHLAVHENLRKYKCDVCDKAFNLKGVSVRGVGRSHAAGDWDV